MHLTLKVCIEGHRTKKKGRGFREAGAPEEMDTPETPQPEIPPQSRRTFWLKNASCHFVGNTDAIPTEAIGG